MKLFRLTVCDFMVYKYKDYKINLKSALPKHGINFRSPTPHLFSDQSSCHQPSQYLLKSLPSEFPHRIIHQLLIIHFLLTVFCFRSSSRHAIQTGVSGPKIIFLYFLMVFLMASSSSSFVFMQFRWGIFNFFASFYSDVLFIYY